MIAERIIIEVPVNPSQRHAGWFLLIFGSLILSVCAWIVSLCLPLVAFVQWGQRTLLLYSPVALIHSSVMAILGVRMAMENQQWVCGENFLERRSEVLGFSWSKIYHASDWRLKCYSWLGRFGGTNYSLHPVRSGAKLTLVSMIMPFYRNSDGRQALELGRQLAQATGWPLQLPPNFERLAKELEL